MTHKEKMVPFAERLAKRFSDNRIFDRLDEEWDAETVHHILHQGLTIAERKIPNWLIRQKVRQDIQKQLGHYPTEKQEIKGSLTLLAPAKIKKPKKSGTSAK